MSEKIQEQEKEVSSAQEVATLPVIAEEPAALPEVPEKPARTPRAPRGRGRRTPSRAPRTRSEYDQRIITIRRVARVVAGGRRFSFSVALIVGNRKGKVGVGLGKAGDTTLAIDKAVRDGKKHFITVRLTEGNSIAHEVSGKYGASRVSISPAPRRGLVAGSSVRAGLGIAGLGQHLSKN